MLKSPFRNEALCRHSKTGSKRLAVLAACLLVAGAAAAPAGASSSLRLGIYDEAQTLFNGSTAGFETLGELRARVLRLNLYWNLVAGSRPADASDPNDPAYDWSTYDRAVRFAAARNIRIVLSIVATPDWANGGQGPRHAPSDVTDLDRFAYAAAYRFSGSFTPPTARPLLVAAAAPLPRIDMWIAWNEPNSPTFLRPQGRKDGDRWVAASPGIYAGICNAVWRGVHTAGDQLGVTEQVACGATNPKGNNIFGGRRASVAPITFLRGLKAAGARFDVYAHHPYAPSRLESPSSRPRARTTVTLGNIGDLIAELDDLYGAGVRLWITEYGYQTNPPDRFFGVSWARQAAYLKQAHAIARKNPRIDLLLWFLIKDESAVSRWQSGLVDANGKKKPAFAAFRALA